MYSENHIRLNTYMVVFRVLRVLCERSRVRSPRRPHDFERIVPLFPNNAKHKMVFATKREKNPQLFKFLFPFELVTKLNKLTYVFVLLQ